MHNKTLKKPLIKVLQNANKPKRMQKCKHRKSNALVRTQTKPIKKRVVVTYMLRTKPAKKPKWKAHKVDKNTGLPLNYWNTVENIMLRSNPNVSQQLMNDGLLEHILTNFVIEIIENPNNQFQQMPVEPKLPKRLAKKNSEDSDSELSHFHHMCKRRPPTRVGQD